MKHTLNKYISSTLGSMVIILMALSVSSCRDELSLGYDSVELGQKVTGSLSVPLNLPLASQVTRSVDFSSGATIKVNDYWIGVYDTHTRELLGNIYDAPLKADNTREELKGANSSLTKSVDIWYYDKHPEVYVVGVVNLKDVKGKKAGSQDDFQALKDLLDNAKTWDDFCTICVDVESMQAANKGENEPILMGYYTSSLSAAHPMVKAWDNNDPSLGNMKIPITESNDGQLTLANGAGSVKLNRLISEVNVTVGGPELTRYNSNSTRADVPVVTPRPPSNYYPDDFIKIKNLEYKVLNNPKTVYLAEHATDPWSYNKSESEYPSRSSNSSDYDGAKGFEDTDWIKVENGKSFTFQHYENKHIGHLSDLGKKFFEDDIESIFHYAHQVREEIIPGTEGLLSSLCLDRRYPANNYAPAFKIRADVEYNFPEEYYEEFENYYSSAPELSGSVEFTIHEGFTSNADGTIIDGSNIGSSIENFYNYIENLFSDYQRRRNTQYNYTISIKGLESIIIQAIAKEIGDLIGEELGDYHNDGISGVSNWFQIMKLQGHGTGGLYGPPEGVSGYEEYWTEDGPTEHSPSVMDLPNEIFGIIFKNRKELKWRYLVHSLNGEQNYGNWSQIDNNARGLPPLSTGISDNMTGKEDILNALKFVVFGFPKDFTPQPDQNPFKPYPEGTTFSNKPPVLYEWTIKDLIEAPENLFSEDDFISSSSGGYDFSKPKFAIYVPDLKAGEDVPFTRLEEVYRKFYFKLPLGVDDDGCSTFNSIFGFEQTALDNRKNWYYGQPSLQHKCNVHHYYHYAGSYGSTAAGLVTYICWNQNVFTTSDKGQMRVDHYELQVGDNDPIIVKPEDYEEYDGYIHFPYSVPTDMSGFQTIRIKPMGFMYANGEPADWKVSSPFVYNNALYVYGAPLWIFNNSSVFKSYAGMQDDTKNFGTYDINGLTILCGTSSAGMTAKFTGGYIQTEGSGSLNNRSFRIIVDRPGKVVVKASGNSSSAPTNRFIRLAEQELQTGDSKIVQELPIINGSQQTEGSEALYELKTSSDINSPTYLSIYGYGTNGESGSIRIYSIEFIPD